MQLQQLAGGEGAASSPAARRHCSSSTCRAGRRSKAAAAVDTECEQRQYIVGSDVGLCRWSGPAVARLCSCAVAAVPCNRCYNNPECSNMSGLSELQLVGGRSCVCASCGHVGPRYCSKECTLNLSSEHVGASAQHFVAKHNKATEIGEAAVAAGCARHASWSPAAQHLSLCSLLSHLAIGMCIVGVTELVSSIIAIRLYSLMAKTLKQYPSHVHNTACLSCLTADSCGA